MNEEANARLDELDDQFMAQGYRYPYSTANVADWDCEWPFVEDEGFMEVISDNAVRDKPPVEVERTWSPDTEAFLSSPEEESFGAGAGVGVFCVEDPVFGADEDVSPNIRWQVEKRVECNRARLPVEIGSADLRRREKVRVVGYE